MTQKIEKGNLVRFYDSYTANREKDYSGENPKHYPTGIVVDVYDYKSHLGYTDRVCDIQIGNRISKAHFVNAVEIVK